MSLADDSYIFAGDTEAFGGTEYDIPPAAEVSPPDTTPSAPPPPEPPLTPRRKAFLLAMSPIVVNPNGMQGFFVDMVNEGLFEITPHGRDTHLIVTPKGEAFIKEHAAVDEISAAVPEVDDDRIAHALERCSDFLEEIAVHLGTLVGKQEEKR